MKTLTKIAIALVALAGLSYGQTDLSTTTLGAAISATTCSTLTIALASTSTMANVGTLNQPNTVLYVDKEYMQVQTVVDSTHATVLRCRGGVGESMIPRAHVNGAIVYFANTSGTTYASTIGFKNEQPNAEVSGACTATQVIGLPIVYLWSGHKYDCLGGQWVETDAPGQGTLATGVTIPAGVLTPTGTIMITDTGTSAMTGITVPQGWGLGMCLEIVPGGAFTWTTATNIAASGTAVAAKVIFFCWDGAKWAANI